MPSYYIVLCSGMTDEMFFPEEDFFKKTFLVFWKNTFWIF